MNVMKMVNEFSYLIYLINIISNLINILYRLDKSLIAIKLLSVIIDKKNSKYSSQFRQISSRNKPK